MVENMRKKKEWKKNIGKEKGDGEKQNNLHNSGLCERQTYPLIKDNAYDN